MSALETASHHALTLMSASKFTAQQVYIDKPYSMKLGDQVVTAKLDTTPCE